ncbi:MAG: SEC-C metal-binding domain-containing protein [Acidobacteriota bacterium]
MPLPRTRRRPSYPLGPAGVRRRRNAGSTLRAPEMAVYSRRADRPRAGAVPQRAARTGRPAGRGDMTSGRNDPCPCGSGRKYKRCCERTRRPVLTPAALVLIAIVALGGAVAVTAMLNAPDPDAPPPGKVWSPEHGHWHDVGGAPARGPIPPPAGPPPPGKVWSPEHGHWHDAS